MRLNVKRYMLGLTMILSIGGMMVPEEVKAQNLEILRDEKQQEERYTQYTYIVVDVEETLENSRQIQQLNQLYDNLPPAYPSIELLYTKGSQHVLHLPTMRYDAQQEIHILVPIEDTTIEYIQYKLNGHILGEATVAPYRMKMNQTYLTPGNNELRVIIKYQGVESLDVHTFYLASSQAIDVPERAPRTTPTYDLNQEMIYQTRYIPVLMYHMFKDEVENNERDQSISVSTQRFEEQLQILKEQGYTPITFLDYENYLSGVGGLPEKPYIIVADDGYLDNYTHAYPILLKYEIPATFFVSTQYVGVRTSNDHFTWDQAREMEASGLIDIQNHTVHHALLHTLNQEVVNYEVNHGFGEIEQQLGKRDVKVFAYPQFGYNEQTTTWLTEWGVQFQMTGLVREGHESTRADIKRIHVHNQLSPEALIEEIERLTQ